MKVIQSMMKYGCFIIRHGTTENDTINDIINISPNASPKTIKFFYFTFYNVVQFYNFLIDIISKYQS